MRSPRQPHVLAAYTCTPLVKFPLSDLKPGEKVKGTTIAELGNRNRPLDMIVYQKDGKDYVLSRQQQPRRDEDHHREHRRASRASPRGSATRPA